MSAVRVLYQSRDRLSYSDANRLILTTLYHRRLLQQPAIGGTVRSPTSTCAYCVSHRVNTLEDFGDNLLLQERLLWLLARYLAGLINHDWLVQDWLRSRRRLDDNTLNLRLICSTISTKCFDANVV